MNLLPAPKMTVEEALKVAQKVAELDPAEMPTAREITISGSLLVLANEIIRRNKEG